MTSFIKKITIVCGVTILSLQAGYAASLTLLSPKKTLPNRQPIVVSVVLNSEGDVLSGIAGNFSFPSEMFSLENISTENSAVSLWVKQPTVSDEKYLDNRTHITFEGIFPGGYDGVRSPYYQGKKESVVFSLTLIPKNQGTGSFIVDDIVLNAFNSQATPLPSESAFAAITVPKLLPLNSDRNEEEREVKSSTLQAFITRDELVNSGAWYLTVNESEGKSAIQKIYVVEDDSYTAYPDRSGWRAVTNPHVLLYQDRTKYVHVKVAYSNMTYSLVTLPPVENSARFLTPSRILISVTILFFVFYLLYGKKLRTSFSKKI